MPNRRRGRRSRSARHQTKLKNSRRYTKAKEKQKESKNSIEKSTSISCRQQAKRIELCFKYIQSLCNEQRTKMDKTSEFDSNIYIKSKFADINEDNVSMTAISDNNNVVLWLSNLHQLVCVGYLRNNIGNIKPNDLASIVYRYLGNLLIQPNTKFASCSVDYHKNIGKNVNNNNGNNKSVLWAFKIWDNEARMQRSYQQIILKIALFSKDSVNSIGKNYVTIALIGLPKKKVSELDLARFESLLHSDENITLQHLQSVSNIDLHVIKFSLSTMNRYEKSKKICLLCDLNENGVYYIDKSKNKNKSRNNYCDGVSMTELDINSYKYINSNFNNDQFVRDEFNINQNKCFVMFNNEYDYKYLCVYRANGTSCNVTIETANIANLNSFYLQQPSVIYKEVRSKNKR